MKTTRIMLLIMSLLVTALAVSSAKEPQPGGHVESGLKPAATVSTPTVQAKAAVSTLKDTQLSLRTDVFQEPEVPRFEDKSKDPGENKILPRAYEGAPPQVSHNMADMKMNKDGNDCLDCHSSKKGAEDEPAIALSHYLDKEGQQLAGSRYVCSSCHVTQLNANPLVTNQFLR